MSQMRNLIKVHAEHVRSLDQVQDSMQKALDALKNDVSDLTNNELWWKHAEAYITGGAAVLAGLSGMGSNAVPITFHIGSLSGPFIREALSTASTALPEFGKFASLFAQGPAAKLATRKTLVLQCDIPSALQKIQNLARQGQEQSSHIQTIMSAKARQDS